MKSLLRVLGAILILFASAATAEAQATRVYNSGSAVQQGQLVSEDSGNRVNPVTANTTSGVIGVALNSAGSSGVPVTVGLYGPLVVNTDNTCVVGNVVVISTSINGLGHCQSSFPSAQVIGMAEQNGGGLVSILVSPLASTAQTGSGSSGVTSVSGTGPISVATGTTTPVISCSTCNTSNATVSSVTGTTAQIDVATGTTTPVISLDPQIVMSGATGGAQGAGTINATGYYINGVAIGTGSVTTSGSPVSTYLASFSGAAVITGNSGATEDSSGNLTALSYSTPNDGVHPSSESFVGNTTLPSLTANTVTDLGPPAATFTAWSFQRPTVIPASGSVLACVTTSTNCLITPATAAQINTIIQGLTGCNTATYVYTPQAADCIAPSPPYVAAAGSVNVLTGAYSPAITSPLLVAGLELYFLPNLANTTTTPTFNPNGLGAATVTKFGTAALAASDLTTTAIADVIYDGTHWQLQNPQTATASTPSFPLTVTGTVNSGGFPCFTSITTEASSATIAAGVLPKGGGTGACLSASSITDNGTTVTTTDTGGYVAPVLSPNGTTATFMDWAAGTTSAAVAPCNTANSACWQAPSSISTAYVLDVPAAAPTNTNSAMSCSDANPVICTFAKMSQTVMLTSQYTNSTTGFTNVTGTNSLAFSLEANTTYQGTCVLYYQAASTGGLNIEFTGPASPTFVTYGLVDPGSATTLVSAAVATSYSTSLGAVVTTATTNFPATVTFGISNGSTAGTLQMLAKSSAAVQLQIQTGSYCVMQ